MKRKFSTRIIAGIATSAVLAVGSLSFTAINAIADEAVSYYGLSADGTVISGTVTDYTKIASTDTAGALPVKKRGMWLTVSLISSQQPMIMTTIKMYIIL